MNYNNLTIKAQEAVQHAFTIAGGYGQQAVETGHLLKAILTVSESISSFIFGKFGINKMSFQAVLDKIIESYPKVSGGEQYISNASSKALQKAEQAAKSMGDQYVSVEHLLLGILDAGDSASQLIKDNGMTEKQLKSVLQELRKGAKVDSQTAEDTYKSLNALLSI